MRMGGLTPEGLDCSKLENVHKVQGVCSAGMRQREAGRGKNLCGCVSGISSLGLRPRP
jgi:hypothetical protein